MKGQKNGQMSAKESVAVTMRTLRLLCHIYPGAIISRIAQIIWNALTPYVGIWFSARIISELAGERNPAELRNLVLLALFSAAVISLPFLRSNISP